MAAPKVLGAIKLVIDDLGLEARLNFIPDAAGPELAADAVTKLISEARVVGVSTKRIDEILGKFAAGKTPASEVLLHGQTPETGKPEQAEWDTLQTPPEFEALMARALSEAAPPQLFHIRVERIAHERIVKKPGALGFLKGKEEKVIEYEKIEKKEAVIVDNQILRSVWVAKNSVVAKLDSPQSGKPGKSVLGKVIPAPQTTDTAFHVGTGLSKAKGGVIVAEIDGFLRIGKQWADVVPFGKHNWEVKQSEDHASVLLDFIPGDKHIAAPEIALIMEAAVKLSAHPDHLLPPEEVDDAIHKSVRTGVALEGWSLSNDRDAEVRVEISPDKLTAKLTVIKGRGRGKALVLSDISLPIKENAIKGIKIEKFKADVMEFYKGKALELSDYLLVEGRAPTPGKNRELSFGITFLLEDQGKEYLKILKAATGLDRHAKNLEEFPLAEVQQVALVKKDQDFAKFSPPSFGLPGTDIFGSPIAANPGNDPVVWPFENVRMSNENIGSMEDGILLVSEKEGETKIRVLAYRDALIEVLVDESARNARINLAMEYGLGRELNLERVQAAIKEEGVSFGIDLQSISAAIADARENREVKNRTIAQAKEPVPAGGFRVNWIVRLASGAAVTIREDGSADFRNQDRATIVSVEQQVLELIHIGQQGQDGMDVVGRIIRAPKDPRVVEPPSWDSSFKVEKKDNGDQIIIALKSGELKFEKNTLAIDPMQKIAGDVGPETGNLKFPGPVAISGSVLSGFSVIAGGDVLVGASIEASLVSADGNVQVAEGIKGAQKATIRARKNIIASYAEQAMLLAVEDVILKSSALLCNIKTNGKLALQSDKGSLIGGLCRVRKGMEAQNIGSEKGIKTQISFGQDYLMKDAIEAEERELEKLKAMILQTDRTMRELEKIRGDLDKVRQDKVKMMKLLEKRSVRMIEMHEKFDAFQPAEISVRGTIFPGVVLESHNRFYEVREKKQRVIFSFDPQLGRIVDRPLK